jgi:hypothetical protein
VLHGSPALSAASGKELVRPKWPQLGMCGDLFAASVRSNGDIGQ